MKNTPTRHKTENTFKFVPFSERIASVDVGIFHRVAHENETESEAECYFYQCIQKWNVLNLTEGYEQFKEDVESYSIITLPQLIHKKRHVVQVLLKHLKLKNTLYLQPLLELLVAVAKDLRKEFCAYYEDVFNVLIDLLNTKNAEQLEWTFTCLAYMFKFLWRPLVRNINKVFILLLPLLSDSKPNYIHGFAAESFSFLARKIRDKRIFIKHMVNVVKEQEDAVRGCGMLLFESMHGVCGQFHSCASETIHSLLESLQDKELREVLCNIMVELIKNMVLKIHPKNSEIYWITLIDFIKRKFHRNRTFDRDTNDSVNYLFLLCGITIECSMGKFLNSYEYFIENFIFLDIMKLSESVLYNYCRIAVLIFSSDYIILSQENVSRLVRKMMNLQSRSVFLYFVEHMDTYSGFETLILPHLLKDCLRDHLEESCFFTLTRIVLEKSPLCGSGVNLTNWKKYPINFGSPGANSEIVTIMERHIAVRDIQRLLRDPGHLLCSLICLPHVATGINDNVKEKLTGLILLLCEAMASVQKEEIKITLYLIQNALEALVHLSDEEHLLQCFEPLLTTLLPLAANLEYPSSLKALDLLLSSLGNNKDVIQMQTLLRINDVLQDNFCSPYREVRLFTAHIYTLFDNLPELRGTTTTKLKAFQLCYKTECLGPQVKTYKDQLHCLEYLAYGRNQVQAFSDTAFKLIPLKYLCGVLYMNFQLLWEPTIKLIATHALGLETDVFWNFFGVKLKQAMDDIHSKLESKCKPMGGHAYFMNKHFHEENTMKDKPDFFNYATLLWKAVSHFPGLAEEKNRVTVELILEYVINSDSQTSFSALTCNIKEKYTNDENKSIKEADKKVVERKGSKIKMLLAMLGVLAKMRNPKALYREPELNRLYYELLSHKNPDIQKEALNCIMNYKHKYLTPYQEHLFNLIDEKNFKNELTSFRVDSDTTVVQAEHREGLMPVVIQIVFAKMKSKIGLRTGGKSSGQQRRNLILRFLAGCRADEMKVFIDKAFRNYYALLDGSEEVDVEKMYNSIDLEKFFLPKRLLSSFHLLDLIFEHFGGLLDESLQRDLLKILLVMGAYVRKAIEASDEVHRGYLPPLRTAKALCLKILTKFFQLFEGYPWTANQINAVFDVFVWPYLDKLLTEGIHSPTALLKLFSQWCCSAKYFPLLVKLRGTDEEQYVLYQVVNLLSNTHCKSSVTNVILEMLENLLTLQSEENATKIPVDNLKPTDDKLLSNLSLNEKLNYGSYILLPQVQSVLEMLKCKLLKSNTIAKRELFILSRISELACGADACGTALQTFLPIVLKRCSHANEEIVNQQLITVRNLLNHVTNPLIFLKQISPMFAEVSFASGRKILCQILQKISEKDDDFGMACELITMLNAWDAKWLDQPDFEKRNAALKQIEVLVENNSLSVDLGVLLIYNCYYLVCKEADLSLRDNASHSLKLVAPYLIKTHNAHIDYVLNETLLKLIRNGFKNKSDEVRNECIALLGCISRECADADVVLKNLSKFANKTDLEVDCFENLTHMQLHRHSRALLKISQILKEQTKAPSARTLTQFLLPMTTFYLCNEKYADKNSLIDAAIEVVNTTCRLLPWHQYEMILKFYLKKLQRKSEYQRQLVRIVVAILDAFHYDLSKAEAEKLTEPEAPPQEDSENSKSEVEENVSEVPEENSEPNDGSDSEQSSFVESEEEEEEEEEEVEEKAEEEEEEAEEEDEEEDNEDEEEEDEEGQEKVVAVEQTTVLCKSAAKRVIRTIEVVLLPQLHRALAEMTHYEGSHKVNRKKTGAQREEEDLVKVPISLAVVKLLQKLPKSILDSNLSGVLMKVCTFLKSHLESVRRVTRETLQNILITLGPNYLKVLLAEMVPLLNRGFQVHVLVYTIHAVLYCLKDAYKPGDVNGVLITVLHICKADLFGITAEEKEVVKIQRKVSEAKSTKTFDTFKLLAQFITDSCLLDLLLPIKEALTTTHSYKLVNRAQECLRHIAIGLTENAFISVESLLKFAYGVASESIPELLNVKNNSEAAKQEQNKIQKRDCFLLPENPGRAGARPRGKISATSNSHHLIQFALRLCHFMLKHEKLKDIDNQVYLDPFVGIFKNCLVSRHVKLSTTALQCLSWAMKYDLPSVRENIDNISEAIFSILHKYAAAGLSKGENFDLVVSAFKAVTVLLRDVKYYNVDKEKLKILLLYAEQDLHDTDRQATAFGLLKAIISRKFSLPELYATMEKVSELSIISEVDHVRLQSRLVCLQYLLEYPLGKKLDNFVSFYVSQLNYELQPGRESALEMIHSFVNSFPLDTLKDSSGTFLVTLGARLVNDDIPECRKRAADCLKSMFNRLPQQDRDTLFDVVILWLKDKKLSHRQMAAHICGIFILAEKESFTSRISVILPIIYSQFGLDTQNNKPGRFVLLTKDSEKLENERAKDHLYFQILQMLLKLCAHCPQFLEKTKDVEILATHVQTLLAHPHEWVRLAAAQFLGFVVASINIDHLAELIVTNGSDAEGYLCSDPRNNVESLTLDLCSQLQPGEIREEFAQQVVKILVFIARVLEKVPTDNTSKLNLLWLTKRMRKVVNTEVVLASTSTTLRNEVFKWIAGVCTVLDGTKIRPVLHHLLAPLVRELLIKEERNAQLRNLAKEVCTLIKQHVGQNYYSRVLSMVEQQFSVKKAERKRVRSQLAVTDPEIYAKKKIKKHEKKKIVKKRKREEMKGTKKRFKKRKLIDLENDEIL